MVQRNNDLYNTLNWKDKGFFSWKGKTFTQITSSIQKNKGITPITTTDTNISALFHANPLKIYRREIASQDIKPCNPRTSVRIDEINRPNGYLLYEKTNGNIQKGLQHVLDIQTTDNKYDLNRPACHTDTNCFSQENNALRRVRSAGMNRKKYNDCTKGDAYNANTAQYLKSRHMTFEQNQFVFQHEVAPSYFKPNNTKFLKEGGVDASSLINRKRYDALTSVGSTLVTPLGNKVSQSLAYAVPFENYIKKGKPFPLPDRNLIKRCITENCVPP